MSYKEYFRDLLVDNYAEDIDILLYKEKNYIIKKIDKVKDNIDEIETYIELSKRGQWPNGVRKVSIEELNDDLIKEQNNFKKLDSELNNIKDKIKYWNSNKDFN